MANVYVPQTGEIYPSAAAAARALGVDQSNISKVLRGVRPSAGGYNFFKVDPSISKASLKQINETVDTGLTEKQKRRKAQRRQASRAKARANRAAQKARNKAARELHTTLVEANSLWKEYRKRGLEGISGIIPELEALKNMVGENKRGFFNADTKHLKELDLSTEQLQSTMESVKKQINRKGFRDIQDQENAKDAIALQFGISKEELDNYTAMLPTLWHIIELARLKQGEDYNNSVYDEAKSAIQEGVDPEQLKEILDTIESESEDIDAKIEEYQDKTGEDPSYTDLMKPYIDEIIKLRADIKRLEQEAAEDAVQLTEQPDQSPPVTDNTFSGYLSDFE